MEREEFNMNPLIGVGIIPAGFVALISFAVLNGM